jgi:hypothetical protein
MNCEFEQRSTWGFIHLNFNYKVLNISIVFISQLWTSVIAVVEGINLGLHGLVIGYVISILLGNTPHSLMRVIMN